MATYEERDGVSATGFALLCRLLALPPEQVRRIRDEAPRRRLRPRQVGPSADLGSDADGASCHGDPVVHSSLGTDVSVD